MLKKIILLIDQTNKFIGQQVSLISLFLVLLVCFDVASRYIFNFTSASISELEWHMFALIFLLAAGYTYQKDKHVRVDAFYQLFSLKSKAIVNLIGGVFFLIPFCLLVLDAVVPYVKVSWIIGEKSTDPSGLAARYIIKSSIWVGFFLLFLQGIAEILKTIEIIGRKKDVL